MGWLTDAMPNADVESRFGMLGEHHLPAPCQLPSEQGILSVADAGESDLPARAAAGESMLHPAGSTELEDTWIIQPQDLACRVVDGKPVLLGSGAPCIMRLIDPSISGPGRNAEPCMHLSAARGFSGSHSAVRAQRLKTSET